jgi:hypothetical protein
MHVQHRDHRRGLLKLVGHFAADKHPHSALLRAPAPDFQFIAMVISKKAAISTKTTAAAARHLPAVVVHESKFCF